MPSKEFGQLFAHDRRLLFVEIKMTVEPPVAQIGRLVVGQFDGAAACEQCCADNQSNETKLTWKLGYEFRHCDHGCGQRHPHEK